MVWMIVEYNACHHSFSSFGIFSYMYFWRPLTSTDKGTIWGNAETKYNIFGVERCSFVCRESDLFPPFVLPRTQGAVPARASRHRVRPHRPRGHHALRRPGQAGRREGARDAKIQPHKIAVISWSEIFRTR